MLTNLTKKIGVQSEHVKVPPTQAIVGTDGSLAFEVTTQAWGPDSKNLGQRTRFVVFERRAVLAAIEAAWFQADPPLVLFQPAKDGRFIPHVPAARDARPDDLPAPLRDGRRIPWKSVATTRPGTAEHCVVDVELEGRTYAVACSSASRLYRPPAAAVMTRILFVPAIVADVVTFPIQVPLALYLYHAYQVPDAPGWVKAVMEIPAW